MKGPAIVVIALAALCSLAGPAVQAVPVREQPVSAAETAYGNAVREMISRFLAILPGLPMDRVDGNPVVEFGIGSDGMITCARITQSSGLKALDAAVRRAVPRAAPYPAFPEGLDCDTWDIRVRFDLSSPANSR